MILKEKVTCFVFTNGAEDQMPVVEVAHANAHPLQNRGR
jgi:hypothetical protein